MTAPTSTYRIQLGPDLDFAAAAELTGYLADLGVGAFYASPVLAAAPGSSHGYDVVDPTRASPALGGDEGFARLAERLGQAGLGLVVDIVPNHQGIAVPAANPAWWDVLEYGPGSAHAGYFDVNWNDPPIMVPVLADEEAVADLKIVDGQLAYYDQRFPIAPGTGEGTPQQVHERQHYRLVDWRRANTELNYRRFFDITTLAAVRVEDPEVFRATHATLLRWVTDGLVTGLRVDHPDGLADPGGYLRRLAGDAPSAWLVVEKILGPDEALPPPDRWPVDGTTGYDELRLVSGLFVDPAGEGPLTALAAAECGPQDLAEMEHDAKRWIAEHILRAEVRRIAEVAVRDLPALSTPEASTEQAVIEVLASFAVYRSYLADGEPGPLRDAAAEAARRAPGQVATVDALVTQMTADPAGELAERVEQTAAMVMAKGVEDTVFYRYNRFVALNEVAGDPGRFGVPPEEFHRRAGALANGPHRTTMTALSTHDNKRSEDVRARLAVLSEAPDEFADALRRWSDRARLPEPTLNLLAWQSLIGAWPISPERLGGYLDKASREAKLATSWTEPDEEFDRAVAAWPRTVLADAGLIADVEGFVRLIRPAGWVNSLGQKLVQLTMPGVPDLYQGSELWDLSLVDPDNRRPVDFAHRRELLARIDAGWLPPIDNSGAAKLLVVTRTLRLRRDRPELFQGYRPLAADGPAAGHALAFQRGNGHLVTVATRRPLTLGRSRGWRGTTLNLPGIPGGVPWTDVLTGRTVPAGAVPLDALLSRYPVALLVRGDQ
ncbi:MAG TPA: malto-oligosyltrehalose synthase [Streptosporangiaceae bacterium]|nr:malto-oligosyltrehalose synthase [Streptosporangiaceae bacterium]